jgi:hypothetical protein
MRVFLSNWCCRLRGAVLVVAGLSLPGLLACERYFPKNEYVSIGQFPRRSEGERQALAYLSASYAALSDERPAKVLFLIDYNPGLSKVLHTHAIWYDKATGELALEPLVREGPSCRWRGVDEAVLARLATIDRGLAPADSLARPAAGSYGTCYPEETPVDQPE